jgi:hypothetical protein
MTGFSKEEFVQVQQQQGLASSRETPGSRASPCTSVASGRLDHGQEVIFIRQGKIRKFSTGMNMRSYA